MIMLRGDRRKWKKSSPHVTRKGFQTEITLATQCLLAFISAFEKMGLFVPGALVEDRVKRGHLRFEEEVLERVGNDPSTSTRAIAHAMGSNQSSVLRVLQEQNLHAYHLQKELGLGSNDFAPRVRFFQWFLQRSVVNPAFPAQVLFTDEACFTRDGYFNS